MHTVSEKSQSQKASYCIIPTLRDSGKGKTVATVLKIQWLPGDHGREDK